MPARRIIWAGLRRGKAGNAARDRGPKLLLLLLLLAPALAMLWDLASGRLAALIYAPLVRETGLWGWRFLLLGLALSPLAQRTGWGMLLRLRRMIGLAAASYSVAHLLLWVMDYGFDWPLLGSELVARRYLMVGFLALVLLLPLAATSFRAAVRRLGGKRWQTLHRLVYPAAVLALWHTIEAHRVAPTELVLYAILLAALLLVRLAAEPRPHGTARADQP